MRQLATLLSLLKTGVPQYLDDMKKYVLTLPNEDRVEALRLLREIRLDFAKLRKILNKRLLSFHS